MKKFILNIIFISLILIISVYVIFYSKKPQVINELDYLTNYKCGEYSKGGVNLNGDLINVLVSDDNCKRELGLSGANTLKNNEGMLFIFEKSGNHGFWMKDMNFPIDILWIDDNFLVVGIEKGLLPETYPKSFGEKYNAKYVLEIPSGYSEKNNIKIGDEIIFMKK